MTKTRPFINKKKAVRFHLGHEKQHPNEANVSSSADDGQANEFAGEACKYNIFFDDQHEYNYLQHLKEIGRSTNAVWIESKTASGQQSKLSAVSEPTVMFAEQASISAQVSSPEDDVDPDLAEIMEALNDDAYLNAFTEDFVEDIENQLVETARDLRADQFSVSDGENSERRFELDSFAEEEFPEEEQEVVYESEDDDDAEEEEFQTGNYRAGRFHNNEKFEKILMEYDSDDLGEGMYDSDATYSDSDDFDDSDFMEDEELLNGQMDELLKDLPDDSNLLQRGTSTMDRIRSDLREVSLKRIESYYERMALKEERPHKEHEASDDLPPLQMLPKRSTWDCETILSTMTTNTENHPRTIEMPSLAGKRKQKAAKPDIIKISHRTGFPLGFKSRKSDSCEDDNDGAEDDDVQSITSDMKNICIIRDKTESAEEKKARKQQVKAERKDRRLQKKLTKQAFKDELLKR